MCSVTGALNSAATTYYVDFSAGSDGNNGTAIATPFQHCPGDNSAADTAGSTTLAAGDTVIFKGGVEYKHTININWSGSSGSVITYDGNSAGTFGTGKATLSGENVDNNARRYGFYSATSHSYLTFKNFEAKLFGGHASNTFACGNNPTAYTVRGYGMYLTGTGLTIQDSYFHDLGDWQNAPNMDELFMEGVGIVLYGSGSSITVSNCEFTKCGRAGIQINSQISITGVTIQNCNIHDYVRWGIDLVAGANNCTLNGVVIDRLRLHDCYQYANNTWLGCSAHFPHYDGIILRTANWNPTVKNLTLGTVGSPITIKNSFFYNNSATATDAGTADIFPTVWGGRLLIYNNLFVNSLSHGYGSIYVQDVANPNPLAGGGDNNPAADYHFYNNSYYGAANMVTLRSVSGANYYVNHGTTKIKNNIFYKRDTGAAYAIETGLDQNSTPTELDYNIYVTGRSDGVLASMNPSGTRTYYTLSQLRAAGYETHGMNVNPQFVDGTFGLGPDSSSNNLRLQATSPAIGAGAVLSNFFVKDRTGTLRAGPWTIGAFNYGGLPDSPQNLKPQ
jgi:parallel beta helix pectate lyase-like protein